MSLDDIDDARPTYQRLADRLRAEITEGRLAANEKVPSVRQLAQTHGVAQMTANHALRELHDEGLVYTIVGRGTFVRPAKQTPPKNNDSGDAVEKLQQQVRDIEARLSALEKQRKAR